jgi:hypothetical protein
MIIIILIIIIIIIIKVLVEVQLSAPSLLLEVQYSLYSSSKEEKDESLFSLKILNSNLEVYKRIYDTKIQVSVGSLRYVIYTYPLALLTPTPYPLTLTPFNPYSLPLNPYPF